MSEKGHILTNVYCPISLVFFFLILIKAKIKVSDTKSSACSKLFVFLQNYSAVEM